MILSNNSQPFSTLFLDLDDTLYPRNSGIWPVIGSRIDKFLIQEMGFEQEFAQQLRTNYLQTFGTTLTGLMSEYDINPQEYLKFVHDVPIDTLLAPDPRLRELLRSIPLKKVIFTNASKTHAKRVIKALEIETEIDLIVDIIKLQYQNKPLPTSYEIAMSLAKAASSAECVMVDDRWENVAAARECGMAGVWLRDPKQACLTGPCITEILELEGVIPRGILADAI